MCGGTDTCIGVWELALSYAATFFTCSYYIIPGRNSQGKIEQMFLRIIYMCRCSPCTSSKSTSFEVLFLVSEPISPPGWRTCRSPWPSAAACWSSFTSYIAACKRRSMDTGQLVVFRLFFPRAAHTPIPPWDRHPSGSSPEQPCYPVGCPSQSHRSKENAGRMYAMAPRLSP